MSKLDIFLVSESVLSSCPNINAISLDRFLSDHRLILLKDNRYDYGPTPFWFFHHWRKKQHQLKKDLGKLDSNIDSGRGKDELIKKRLETIHQIQKLDRLEALETAQKAKIKWAIDGDENTGFYHGIINKRRSIQNIRGIMVEGKWIDEPDMIKKEFLDHFTNRFCKPVKSTASIDANFHNQLDSDQQSFLERDVTNAEIKKVVWECGTDKAPGPDGFSFGIFRHFWYLMDVDVYAVVRYFFTHCDLPKGSNSSFIALIPKIPDANMVKDFRPISLIGCIYKIIAKVLTNRLIGVLGGIINEVQSTFIEDRQILDGPFILNEVMSWLSIFIGNGISSYFVQRVVEADILKGIKVGGSVNLSHMFYADDAVFVGEWSESNIISLIHVLDCFHRVSGLKINLNKSKLMGIEVDSAKVARAAGKFGCLVLMTPFLYLGSYVGGNMHRLQSWDDIVNRVRSRLSKWKMQMLSIGGRLTLVKSVLGSMPIFHMSLFKVPSGTLRLLESIRGKFFNGHDLSSKKVSWVQWDKANGVKAISSLLSTFLIVSIGVIKAIHGADGNIDGIPEHGASSCWLNIINEVKVLEKMGIHLLNYMHMNLGNGFVTSFWDDRWCADGRLKDIYPRVYALENHKKITVGEKLAQLSLVYFFRRVPRGGAESSQVEELKRLIQPVIVKQGKDSWNTSLSKSGMYSVASVRNLIDSSLLPSSDMKTRWISYIPNKVNVFTWKVMTNSLPMRFNISRRGIDIESISCVNCVFGVESTNHQFFTYDLAKQVSKLIARWWDISYMDIDSYDNWRNWIDNIKLLYKNKLMLEGIFFVMWWLLWNFRNKKIFEDKAPNKVMFFNDVICKSYYWCQYRSKKVFSWDDWFKNPQLISL
nr:RNA-directed DNA polymerase, eukaryota [Tanacetum cinerariifolium]